MKRARAVAAVLLWIGALLPSTAPAQNLEAGKSPGQLFTNTCTACHRSPRGLLRTVPPGSLPGFLREHYTTSRDMAQQLAGFLISNGATDTRGRPQEVRQQPPGTEPPRQPRPSEPEQQARPRQAEPEQQLRPQRPIEQEPAARPAEPPQTAQSVAEAARLARRERRAKRDAERAARSAAVPNAGDAREALRKDQTRRSRITPARIEAATARGKDALPLGSVVPTSPAVEAKPSEPDVAPPEPVKPPASTSSDSPMRSDPVPQVTPAPPVSAEAPREAPEPSPPVSDDPPARAASPAEPMAPSPPASSGPPPAPPISN